MAEHKQKPNNSNFIQGYYKLQNPSKYVGDPGAVIYRSSWEQKFMIYCDLNPLISNWGSETVEIPYFDRDRKPRRYFPDFFVEMVMGEDDHVPRRYIVEVKPYMETIKPKAPKTITAKSLESWEYQLKTYEKNICKWSEAENWCNSRGMKFLLITERNLKV